MRTTKRRTVVSRREFMRLSALATAGGVMVACGAPSADEAAPVAEEAAPEPETAGSAAEPVVSAGGYSEAPMLADLVASGDLPAVDERLPANPMVMPVAESTGNYGGTFRRGFKGVSDRWGPTKIQDRGLCWYDGDFNMQPRLADSWEISDDATEWTFYLREGTKWSDGHPFTTEAIQWWYDNDLMNTDITPAPGGSWVTGAENTVMELEVVDDYTFKLTFADANPLFIFKMGRLTRELYLPGHYLSQFHAELTDDTDALEAATSEAGFETWDQLYVDRRWWYLNPELPSISPWIAKNELSNELFVMERNPYFFAVDADGNQLPYVDNMQHRLFETPDVFDLWIINGEIDFQARHVQLGSFTLYKENEADGDYEVFVGTSAGHKAVQLNLTTKNEQLREFFQNRDVRIALSKAVDRESLNELVFDGLLTPRQYSPLNSSPNASESQASAYIDYSVEEANELLDGAGYSEKDDDGFRLWNDDSGDPISFVMEGTAQPGTPDEDAAQQVVKYYSEIGIKASYKGFERSLYEEHWGANEIEAAWWGGDRTVLPIVAPWIFLGTMIDRPWADAWGKWRNDPTDPMAEEPPADHWIWDIWNTWDQIALESDSAKRNELFQSILDIWAEELPMVGYLGESPALIIVKNGVRNYLPGMPIDDTTGDEHLLNTETYFWDNPEDHV